MGLYYPKTLMGFFHFLLLSLFKYTELCFAFQFIRIECNNHSNWLLLD